MDCLSRMQGNLHVRFLGEGGAARRSPYPTYDEGSIPFTRSKSRDVLSRFCTRSKDAPAFPRDSFQSACPDVRACGQPLWHTGCCRSNQYQSCKKMDTALPTRTPSTRPPHSCS
jgi:hypothetical protein